MTHCFRPGSTNAAIALCVALAACSPRPSETPAPLAEPAASVAAPASVPVASPVPGAAASAPADAWVGRWIGPEGTYLQIDGQQGRYKVAVRNLDGERSFDGEAVGADLRFERDGVVETVRATDGAQTGMKWLADKRTCLTVKPGEGYCRD